MAPSRALALALVALVAIGGFAPLASAASHIANDYSNFYEAVEMYSQNHDEELSQLKALLDSDPYSAIKDELMAAANGTLFAPTNDAVVNLLTVVGYGTDGTKPVSVEDVLNIESLRKALGESLQLHYVNGSYSGVDGDTGVMHHEWWLHESENRTASTYLGEDLHLFADGDNTTDSDLKIYYSSEYTADNLAATVVGKDVARTNASVVNATHEGHVHTIDTVLLSSSLRELANSGAGFNFEDEINEGNFSTVKTAIMLSNEAKYQVLGPGLTGAVFAPTNAAFETFFKDMGFTGTFPNAAQAKRVLYEHIIATNVAAASENTTTEYSTLMDGSEGGANVTVEFVNEKVTTLMNEGESAAATLFGCNFRGGCVYTIDKVLVSSDTKNFFMSDFSSPANGNWKNPNLLPSDVSSADADAAEALLEEAGLAGLLNDETNEEGFTMFIPKEAARSSLLSKLDLSAFSDVGLTQLRKLLDSYRVPASKYDGSLTEDKSYETANPDVRLTKTANGITVQDMTTGRKLLDTASETGLSSPMAFDSGKVLYFMDDVPVTTQMVQDALDSEDGQGGGAGQAIPSIFTIASMLICGVVALLRL